MEREKQRKLDKERADRDREEYLRKKREVDEAALSKMDGAEAAKFLARSKFDSESDEEGGKEEARPALTVKPRKSRFRDVGGPNDAAAEEEEETTPAVEPPPPPIVRSTPSPPPEPPKTREELLEEVVCTVLNKIRQGIRPLLRV